MNVAGGCRKSVYNSVCHFAALTSTVYDIKQSDILTQGWLLRWTDIRITDYPSIPWLFRLSVCVFVMMLVVCYDDCLTLHGGPSQFLLC